MAVFYSLDIGRDPLTLRRHDYPHCDGMAPGLGCSSCVTTALMTLFILLMDGRTRCCSRHGKIIQSGHLFIMSATTQCRVSHFTWCHP